MSEIDEIKAMLERRADQIAPHTAVPTPMIGRVRRRIALNAVAVGAMVAVVAVGAFTGVRALRTSGSSPGIEPAASTPAYPACTSGQLRATESMQGAAGSREGAFHLTNFSDKTCTLQGTPSLILLDKNLKPITSGVLFGTTPSSWEANGKSRPTGWPVVTLSAGGTASVRIRWSNWCPQGRTAPLWQIKIPNSGTVNVNGDDAAGPPPCNGAILPSTVNVGPFEPGSV